MPLRIECGKREAQAGEVSLKDRLGYLAGAGGGGGGGGGGVGAALAALHRVGKGGRVSVPLAALPAYVALALEGLQEEMLRRATAARDACLVRGGSYAELAAAARAAREEAGAGEGEEDEGGASGGGGGGEGCVKAFLLPWADDAAAEARVKADTRYSLRCFPHGEQAQAEGQLCSFSGKKATHMALFARAY